MGFLTQGNINLSSGSNSTTTATHYDVDDWANVFFKDSNGMVHANISMINGHNDEVVVPAGFRPIHTAHGVLAYSEDESRTVDVSISPNGKVHFGKVDGYDLFGAEGIITYWTQSGWQYCRQ